MNKKHFTIACLALALGAFGGVCAHFAIGANADAIMVKAEEAQSSAEAQTSEEEASKLKKIAEELTEKYNQIRDTQVAGTTIGAIAGALVGAIVSAIPSIINRSNIKKAIENVDACRENVSKVNDVLATVKEKFGIVSEDYAKAIEALAGLSEELETVKASLGKAWEKYDALKRENEQLREIFVIMVNHTKEYVANGTAEYVNSKIKG